ncbi:MAG TPA: MerR family transcriptional regulator [Mycobacterium sp.]|jgi:DNA-binding transcriptional MerR regulator|nr:MerR family transcriptional regulator [Mycobacterium sp.]
MTLIPIGQAAARLGLSTSALRYYEDRGLVSPVRRQGQRRYGADELRRLAFIKIAQHLGVPLQTAAAVLDTPGRNWRPIVQQQIAELDRIIAQAKLAQDFLTHALHCPADHPARQCPNMTAALDSLVNGTTIDQLARSHASI